MDYPDSTHWSNHNAVHLTVRGELVEPPASQLEPFDKLVWCFWLILERLERAGVEGHRQASAVQRTDLLRTLPPTPRTSMKNLAAVCIDRRFERKLT